MNIPNYIKQIKNKIDHSDIVNIVLGAGDVWYGHEWITTNIEELDVRNRDHFEYLFENKKADRFLCEHVWEHLTTEEALQANENIYEFLKDGGLFRVAVPDGLFPDEDYIWHVKPNGIGSGSDEHKVLYTYDRMFSELECVGFKVDLLEYWDEKRKFVFREWDERDGLISRSKRFDERNSDGKIRYTSIIADARKYHN